MKLKTKYRVVTDKYLGYEAQFKPWYYPFWLQCFGVNTANTLERAKTTIERHKKHKRQKNRVVYVET